MVAIIVGVILLIFSVLAVLPGCLNWGAQIIAFLKGATPVFAFLTAIFAIFTGIDDIKDKREAKKEESEISD